MTITLQALLIVGSLYSPHAALARARQCGTPTSWAEQVQPGVWVPVCGDAEGRERPSCQESAELAYALAEAAGRDADGAYEDAVEACSLAQ